MINHQVAFLGPEASFTHLATQALFPEAPLLPIRTIPECIEMVSNGQVEIAVVPLENALEGTVPLTIDYLFHEANVFVIAEILSPIAQHLMVHPNNEKDGKRSQTFTPILMLWPSVINICITDLVRFHLSKHPQLQPQPNMSRSTVINVLQQLLILQLLKNMG